MWMVILTKRYLKTKKNNCFEILYNSLNEINKISVIKQLISKEVFDYIL